MKTNPATFFLFSLLCGASVVLAETNSPPAQNPPASAQQTTNTVSTVFKKVVEGGREVIIRETHGYKEPADIEKGRSTFTNQAGLVLMLAPGFRTGFVNCEISVRTGEAEPTKIWEHTTSLSGIESQFFLANNVVFDVASKEDGTAILYRDGQEVRVDVVKGNKEKGFGTTSYRIGYVMPQRPISGVGRLIWCGDLICVTIAGIGKAPPHVWVLKEDSKCIRFKVTPNYESKGFIEDGDFLSVQDVQELDFSKGRTANRQWVKDAEQGDSEAQTMLGYCYLNGDGVARDYVQAYKWFILTSTGTGFLSHIEARMTPEQIAEAKKLAAEFKPVKEK